MGFEVEVAHGLSIAIKPKDIVVSIDAILAENLTARVKKIEELAECKLSLPVRLFFRELGKMCR
jgi:hypothetical protein